MHNFDPQVKISSDARVRITIVTTFLLLERFFWFNKC